MRKIDIVAGSLAFAAFASNGYAALIFSNWVGASSGNWNVAANWDPAVIPNNGTGGNTYVVRIDNNTKQNSTVTHTTGTTALDGLIIDAGDTLMQNNNTTFDIIGFVTNNGVWQLNSAGNATDIRINGVEVTFDGGGVLQWGNHINNRLYGINALRRLINAEDHTIRGAGQLGLNSNLKLTNDGLIDATISADLIIDLTDGVGNFNNSVLRSSAAGNLRIVGTHFDNNEGVIAAIDNGLTRIESSTIVGGELRTQDAGEMRIQGTTRLQDVTVEGALTQPNNTTVDLVNAITVNGEWTMNSVGNATDVRLDSDAVITGNGEVVLSNNIQNRFYGINALRRLTIDPNSTVRGSGQIGLNSNLKLTNDGLIDATQSQTLTVDLTDGPGNFNNNVIRSSASGNLLIAGSHFDNSAGVIAAIDSGVTSIQNATIVGGELRTQDAGEVRIQGTTRLQDVTVEGTLTQPNNSFVDLVNGITVNGEWRMNSVGNATDVRLDSDAVIAGNGEVVMSNNLQNRFQGINALRHLTIDPTMTIRGSGQIGFNTNLKMTNNGLIDATQSLDLIIDLTDGTGNFNNSILQSSASGNLRIMGTHFDNNDGVIAAIDNGLTRIETSTIVGGELQTEGGGEMRIQGTTRLQDVTIEGTLTQPNNTFVDLVNGITVNGEWRINSVGNATDVRLDSDAVIAGNGEVVMSNNLQNRFQGINALRHLTIDPTMTIRGSGQIGFNTNLRLTNNGSIIADQAIGLTIDLTDSQTFLNTGMLRVTGAGTMNIQPSGMDQQGQVLIDATRTLTRNGNFVQTAGTTTVNGTLALVAAGVLNLQGGILNGTGNITGPVNNTGGSVEPGNSAGNLTITGAYTQGHSGKMRVEIGGLTPGTQHDRLTVTGAASLAGIIEVALINKYQPVVGDTFTVLTAGTLTGNFRAVVAPAGIGVTYQGNTVIVKVVATPCAADITFDSLVNVNDLLAVINGWGPCTNNPCPPKCTADVTNDCIVNVNDLLAVINSWGACP